MSPSSRATERSRSEAIGDRGLVAELRRMRKAELAQGDTPELLPLRGANGSCVTAGSSVVEQRIEKLVLPGADHYGHRS